MNTNSTMPSPGIPSPKVSRLRWITTIVISTLLWLVASGGTANIDDYQGVTLATTSVAAANFASGTVIEGQVTEFVVVPGPGALALAATGLAAGLGLVCLRSRRVASVRG